MDLIPTPGQVVSAASNVAHSVLYGGLADLRPMPRSLIYDGYRRELYHYRPDPEVTPTGDPVLLVTPLAAPSLCFDLRRGCSLVEHFVQGGRPTYLVEYGEVSFADRRLGLEYWIDEAVPAAIKEASEHAGGRPVHVVGWSLGGIFALLTAADRHDLPIASVTAIGTPIDVTQVPLVAPFRPLLNLTDGRGAITMAYRALGGAPKPVVSWAFQLASVQKVVTKPIAVMQNLDDRDYLAQLEAVDRFTANMTAYPGRTFGQLYHRFIKGNALQGGSLELCGSHHHGRRHQGPRCWSSPAPRTASPRSALWRRSCRCSQARARPASRSCPADISACSPVAPPAPAPGRPRRVGRPVERPEGHRP